MKRPVQITRYAWAHLGGLENPRLFRRANRLGGWSYWKAS